MASMSFADLTSLLYENYGSLVVDNVVRQGPGNWLVPDQTFLGRLRASGRIFMGGADGNDRYVREWGVKSAGKTAVSYDVSDAFPAATHPAWADASIGWKREGVTVDIDNLVRLATRNALRGNRNGFGEQINDALKALIHKIELDLATNGAGNGGKDITGFLAFLSTALTYATIDQGVSPWWQANIINAGAVALSKSLLRQLVRQAANDRNGIGSMAEIWVNVLQYQKFITLYEDNVRFAPGQTTGSLIPRFMDGGFDIPVYVVRGVPTTEVWLLNLDEIEFRFLDHTPQDMLAQVKDQEMAHEGIPIGFEQLFTGRDSKAIFMKAYGNLACTNPYHQSAITNLSVVV